MVDPSHSRKSANLPFDRGNFRRTGVVSDPRFAGHCPGAEHPECPERVEVLADLLLEPDFTNRFFSILPMAAGVDDLKRVHSTTYIQRIAATEGKPSTTLDEDTTISALSHDAALLAAGGICEAVARVCNGELDNALAVVRPPGHHAERAEAKGFCLYNNVAVGVRYAQSKMGLTRVLVVDWDLHHGNGTQHCFEDDPTVLFFSIHRAFFYPGSGRIGEVGKGAGRGFTVNIPLIPGFGDGEYLQLFETLLRPIALEFAPELILVSAGFDIHLDDPMGGMKVTPKGFAAMTSCLLSIADDCCGGRLVMTLEGGYNLSALKDSVREVLKELIGLNRTEPKDMMSVADSAKTAVVLWRVLKVHRRFWRCLSEGSPEGRNIARPTIRQRWADFILRVVEYFKT